MTRLRPSGLPLALGLVAVAAGSLALAACDGGLSGTAFDNRPPETDLSVRDTSLVGQIPDADRLTSNVLVSWSGTDPDGFVTAYEVRYYPAGAPPAADAGWTRTTRRDTLLLLPITRGDRFANVVVEVRAVDNEGAADPTPARTVFPIRNSPPTFAFDRFETPPETTWTIASFAFGADDPEGASNLARIEIALNDSTRFVTLPPETRYVTLVGDADRTSTATTTEARVYVGRTFQATAVRVPGLRLDAANVLYARAVDQTDTTSAVARYPAANATAQWHVKKPRSRTLVVNDYRRPSATTILGWHLGVVTEAIGERPDVWNVETPYATGSTGLLLRSPLVGTAEPFLRETLALWDRIYWVTSGATNSGTRNNLPFAASVMGKFLDRGGRVLVHSPVTVPATATELDENTDNAALFLLPVTALVPVPDSLRSLTIPTGNTARPAQPLPGTGLSLPALRATSFILTTLPYGAQDSRTVPVLTADFQYQTRVGNRRGLWTGPATVASVRLGPTGEPTVGLMSLPLVSESTGQPQFVGADGDPGAARQSVRLMLQALRFF